jgi:hypothetical protein
MPNFIKNVSAIFLVIASTTLLVSSISKTAFALDEKFPTYAAPQALGMGDAYTADASGYAALYHNPAGLATATRKRWELNLIDIEGGSSIGTLGQALSKQTFGMYRLFGDLKENPGKYSFLDIKSVPSFAMRGFGVSFIGSHRFAGVSDGTNLDALARQDVGFTVGYARYFAGNVIKLGVAAKVLNRNEMKGVFAHSQLEQMNDESFKSLYREGYGFGFDIGTQITLPNKWLPTLGVAWTDILDTHFQSSHFLNSQASGAPDSIPQSINIGFSVHPILSRRLRSTFSIEYKHVEDSALPWRKHLHFGFQLEDEKALYLWVGFNKLYPSLAVGYRVRGGNLEVGTYGEDIGQGSANKLDQRVFFRYTIGY